MNKVLALTEDGKLTYCTASPDMRGKGRCNHVIHQKEGQSNTDFVNNISDKIVSEDNSIVSQTEYIVSLLKQYGSTDGQNENPDWERVLSEVKNPFTIGIKGEEGYREAELKVVEQIPEGEGIRLVAHYEFEQNEYEVDFGCVPIVNEDGTITIDGVDWRVLPIFEQYKAGVISYQDTIVICQKDNNYILSMPKDLDSDVIRILKDDISIDLVEHYFKTGETELNGEKLENKHLLALNNLDPIMFERFPNLKEDFRQLKGLPPDEPNDISFRRCIRYEDMVQEQMQLQMRRMGNTFRSNLAKQDEHLTAISALGNGQPPHVIAAKIEEIEEKYPLFYQKNLSENIKSDLLGRSNVQYADNLNPISALSQSQKVSFVGRGGFNKDKAPYILRMPHNSHQEFVDSMDVSSGKNVGLTATLSNGIIGEDRLLHKREDGISPSDFIPYKLHNDPSRAIMAVAHMKQACPITGGEDPIVKTPAWDKISGTKLGTNLRIAYLPSSDTFEDAVIISESAAAKMTTVQSQQYDCKDKVKLTVGQKVERKQRIGDQEIKVGGIISSVSDGKFTVETTYKMGVGDKLAGRHGNKSVVSRVLPDDKMPRIVENGVEKHAEVIMSPLSVVGRKNLGQIMETNEAAGKGSSIDHKSVVITSAGKKVEATAGVQYIMRLNHIAEKKLSSYADEVGSTREAEAPRLGEMESILLSTNTDRLKVLNYLRHQESYDSHNKLNSLLKSIGVDIGGVNWD